VVAGGGSAGVARAGLPTFSLSTETARFFLLMVTTGARPLTARADFAVYLIITARVGGSLMRSRRFLSSNPLGAAVDLGLSGNTEDRFRD
jgi:hypothetical protein